MILTPFFVSKDVRIACETGIPAASMRGGRIDPCRDILALYGYNWVCILDCRSEPMLPLHLQSESHIPLYVQLRDQLRALVHSGDLHPGDRIPASRELASQLGVHRTTVANAYAELESEGLIQGHVGRGTFIRAGNGAGKFTPPPPPPPALRNAGTVRWESLFADEHADDNLHRLTRP